VTFDDLDRAVVTVSRWYQCRTVQSMQWSTSYGWLVAVCRPAQWSASSHVFVSSISQSPSPSRSVLARVIVTMATASTASNLYASSAAWQVAASHQSNLA